MFITCKRSNDSRERHDADIIVRENQMLSLTVYKYCFRIRIREQHIPAVRSYEADVCMPSLKESKGMRTARRLDELRC